MIVRILGEGQLQVDDSEVDGLNTLDEDLQRAVDAGDEDVFRAALAALLSRVHKVGTPLPLDSLEPSDLLLPPADADLDEVRDMLGDEGLIPG